jgi:hypothetical protein
MTLDARAHAPMLSGKHWGVMTPKQRNKRIKRLQEMIEAIREQIAWLKKSKFSTGPGTTIGATNNAQLIEAQEKYIVTYESVIARLKAGVI